MPDLNVLMDWQIWDTPGVYSRFSLKPDAALPNLNSEVLTPHSVELALPGGYSDFSQNSLPGSSKATVGNLHLKFRKVQSYDVK